MTGGNHIHKFIEKIENILNSVKYKSMFLKPIIRSIYETEY